MKKLQLGIAVVALLFVLGSNVSAQQRGYYDAPYIRYEAETGTLAGGAVALPQSYSQPNLQSEASGQVCADMTTTGASVQWTVTQAADGLVVRYCVPMGTQATVGVYANGTKVGDLTLTSTWSWEHLWNNGNSNNVGVTNQNYRKRFDEVRLKLPAQIPVNGTLKLVTETGTPYIDYAELEPVPAAVTAPSGSVTYTGNGSDLQTFINSNGGKIIYIPTGVYNVTTELYFGVNSTTLQGAGMWYTQLNFTSTGNGNGGLRANATNICFYDLYLTTVCASRSNSYKAINGVFTSGSVIKNIWEEHFECGAWIGQYNTGGPANANGFNMNNCRFRDNYADGTNLCMGTVNATVEHCSYRSNGDDDMAIWSADNMECRSNTFQYNTAENSWRAGGFSIYGGYSNTGQYLLIKDNLEVGVRLNNSFAGSPFNSSGMHTISNVTIIGCGTFNDLYDNQVGAIDIAANNVAGTQVANVTFSNVDVLNSKNDACYFYKIAGDGLYNLIFQNVTVNGTGKEYPYNDATNKGWGRGYGLLFAGAPNGYGTYCNMTYANQGGNATVAVNSSAIGNFTWTAVTGCTSYAVTGVSISPTTETVGVGQTFTVTGTVSPINASNNTITYSVASGSSYASVNANSGLVTGLAAGTATIRATTADGGYTADCIVTVQAIPVTGITLNATTKTIGVGQTFTITPTILPTDATNKNVTYAVTSGSAYASVNSSGVVTAIAAGTATITATTADGSKTAQCVVTIEANYLPLCEAPTIVLTTTAPTIDNTIDAVWANAPTKSIALPSAGTTTPTGFSARWRSLYTSTDLYFLVEVTKTGTLYNQNGTSWWKDDAVEIFIDGTDSKTTTDNGTTDFQYGFRYNDGTAVQVGSSNPTNSTTGITYDLYTTSVGYNVEISIPWTTLKVTPAVNNNLGLEVAVDVSNGTSRVTQMATFDDTGMAYSNPSLFGTVALSQCTLTTDVTNISTNAKDSRISIISFDNTIKVTGLNVGEVISIYNILGAKVYSLKASQDTEYITSLKEGIYAVSVDGTGTAEKVLVLK